jgi:hypothetical protein
MRGGVSLFVILLLAHIVIYLTSKNPVSLAWFGNLMQWIAVMFGLILILGIAKTSRKPDFSRWMCISFGLLLMLLGQTLLSYSELVLKTSAYGSISDAFWLIGFTAIGIALFQIARNVSTTKSLLIAHIAACIILAGVVWYSWDLLSTPKRGNFIRVLDVSYSLLEAWMFVLASLIALHSEFKKPWILAAVSLAFLVVVDAVIIYFHDIESPVYRYFDIFYFIGLSAWWLLGATYRAKTVPV